MNKYYIAYAHKNRNGMGFGDMVITNKNKLKMNTIEDIETIKDFVTSKLKEEYGKNEIEGITIMDFRELEAKDEKRIKRSYKDIKK